MNNFNLFSTQIYFLLWHFVSTYWTRLVIYPFNKLIFSQKNQQKWTNSVAMLPFTCFDVEKESISNKNWLMKSSLKHISNVSNYSLVEMIDGIFNFFENISKSYMINSVKICFRWKSWVLVEGCLKEDWGIRWRKSSFV